MKLEIFTCLSFLYQDQFVSIPALWARLLTSSKAKYEKINKPIKNKTKCIFYAALNHYAK